MVNREQKKFAMGDKVFAKVRGHPPWPAKIEGITDENTKHAKYNVFFYGTHETAQCKLEELFEYSENKEKFRLKAMKRKAFLEGLDQLEEELKNDTPPAAFATKEKKATPVVVPTEDASNKKVNSQVEPILPDSDAELGELVIDESGEKKKTLKRKSMAVTNTPEAPEVKKKRGRPKENTPKQDTTLELPQEEAQEKEVISRSGRKIKPKRFADSDGVETEKNDHHPGRGRPKKTEEVVDNSPVVTKKRQTAERKSNVTETTNDAGLISTTLPDKPGRFLPVRTFSGENVAIKLGVNRPLSFPSEKAQEQWESANARKAMKLKSQLESGEIFPDQVKDRLDFNVQVPLDGKKPVAKDGTNQQQTFKLKWLRIESQLLELDAQIKSNLGLDKANADQCLQAMDVMLNLSIDPLMLKKHPQIVETIKRLRRYIGNLSDWKLTEEETISFKQKAEQIRQKAEHIYNKFKAMFTIPEGQSFWQSFSDQVDHFKELTKDMSEEKMFSLIADPANLNKTTDADISLTKKPVAEDGSIVMEVETKEDENDNDAKDSTPAGSENK